MHLSSLFLTSALLLSPVLPLQAQGRLPDPIAYSCYFCTEEEMEQVAIDQGAGEHYVYDARNRFESYRGEGIFGYSVTFESGIATATRFTPEYWLKQQYGAMMLAYSIQEGTVVHRIKNVDILPPDSAHGRSSPSSLLWGHHTTALNPLHPRARETLRRWIPCNAQLDYMQADQQHGRVLQFSFQKNGMNPTILRLSMVQAHYGEIDLYHVRSTGEWVYRGARDRLHPIQDSASDFVGPSGRQTYEYPSNQEFHWEKFMERAAWASVPVVGTFSARFDDHVDCENVAGKPVCTIVNN